MATITLNTLMILPATDTLVQQNCRSSQHRKPCRKLIISRTSSRILSSMAQKKINA